MHKGGRKTREVLGMTRQSYKSRCLVGVQKKREEKKERRRGNVRTGIYTGVLQEAVSVMEHQRKRENRDEAVCRVTWIKGSLKAASSRNVREY